MPWFMFEQDFDHRFAPRAFKAYKAGQTVLVTSECAKAAEEAGRGKRVKKPKATSPETDEGAVAPFPAASERVTLHDTGEGDGEGS
ncbi:hypothetical protein [Marinicauda sp. Alg238-R41]|uniref:hypothetical protein n=1 Tax=Marinicauda sp. Alg238-R41 TaxID=2993447 RepID=UPI0022E58B81|nr:hypothetical protein [Marinicauda sp. Alg238-R41]